MKAIKFAFETWSFGVVTVGAASHKKPRIKEGSKPANAQSQTNPPTAKPLPPND